jgi:hypothetical protein
MAEFSAHRVSISPGERVVIATPIDLYVSPYGDDVFNSGIEETSPFRTPARAIEWLSDKYISEFGFVTVNFAAGIYDISDQLIFDHAQGNRVAFIGADVDTLLLQYVSDYFTRGFTAPGFVKYYSGVWHGITMSCVRPDENTVYSTISNTGANAIASTYRVAGNGVIVEDYEFVYKDDYNPVYFYSSYPFQPRNNIARQGSILGCHVLNSVTAGILSVESTIRDDWFALPSTGNSLEWARMYGNPQIGVSYLNGSCADPADQSEFENDQWFLAATVNGDYLTGGGRGMYMSNVPVGYYGTNARTGIPIGATSNFVGASFPYANALNGTGPIQYKWLDGSTLDGWYTATGPAGTFLNDTILFGNNYHAHASVNGRAGIGFSAGWKVINTNNITVKIIPTVFRRFGNILKISGGMRKIKNIFFDGVDMPAHYGLIDENALGSTNKGAIQFISCRAGESVVNEPDGLGPGLCSNVGIKDFHIGVFATRGSDVDLGKVVLSNCSYGVFAYLKSNLRTIGSVCTGIGTQGFGAAISSTMRADRCFASFSGQSLVNIRMLQSGTTMDFAENSFNPGQTYSTPDGRIKGTVFSWDPREKILIVAVKVGVLEGGDPTTQYH